MGQMCFVFLSLLSIIYCYSTLLCLTAKSLHNNPLLFNFQSYFMGFILCIPFAVIVKLSYDNDNMFLSNSNIIGAIVFSVSLLLGTILLCKPHMLKTARNNLPIFFFLFIVIILYIFALDKTFNYFEIFVLLFIFLFYNIFYISRHKNEFGQIYKCYKDTTKIYYLIILVVMFVIVALLYQNIFSYFLQYADDFGVNQYDMAISLVSIVSAIPVIIMTISYIRYHLYHIVITSIFNFCIIATTLFLSISFFRFNNLALQKDIYVILLPIIIFTTFNISLKCYLKRSFTKWQSISMILTPLIYYLYLLF